jgi:hypothetical protein
MNIWRSRKSKEPVNRRLQWLGTALLVAGVIGLLAELT